jgi:ribosomal-protein-alanine N-acetyltransferase
LRPLDRQRHLKRAIQIVPFRLRHLDRILQIERASFGPDAWPREAFLEYYDDCRELFFVVKFSRRIAGYIIGCVDARDAEIASLAVHPDYRRRGLAAALIGRALRELRAAGIRRVELMVRVGNTAGEQLYRSLGFRRVRTVPGYYEDGGDGILMRLNKVVRSKIGHAG